jgi:hypothetical protein
MPAFLKRILAWSAAVWATAYIGLILAAAGVYLNLPEGSFYDSNLRREPTTGVDENRLKRVLTQEIQHDVSRRYHGYAEWKVGNLKLKLLNPPIVTKVTTPTEMVPNTLDIEIDDFIIGLPQEATPLFSWVAVNLAEEPQGESPNESLETYGIPVTPAQPQGGPGAPSTSVSPPLPVLIGAEEHQALEPFTLHLRPHAVTQIVHFYQVLRGDPTAGSGQWWRMLYFSATTITTLGFGDITPVTTETRILVTIEAVLGVIFVGLFLNALAMRIRDGPLPRVTSGQGKAERDPKKGKDEAGSAS